MKRIVIDLDDTITFSDSTLSYAEQKPNTQVIEKLRYYKEHGFDIIIQTARNMKTFNNSIGKINAITLPIILEWLERHDVPFDEVHVGKPWCGLDGFYVDDKAVRPSEFINLSYDEITALVSNRA